MTASAPFSITINAAPGLPAWRVGQAIGEWRLVSSSSLSGVTGVTGTGGNFGRNSIVEAWNGTCVNPLTSEVYLLACGGHTDYNGNEVYSIDLETDSPTWVLRRNSSTPTPANSTAYSDGRPNSAHTYNSQVFVPQANRAMRFGNGSRWSDGLDDYRIWGFNPDVNDWDAQTTYPLMGTASGQQAWAVVADSDTGDVYMAISDGGTNRIRRWNRATNTMSTVLNSGYYGYYATAAFDSNRRRAIFSGENGNYVVNVDAGTGGYQSISGVGTSRLQHGMIYVSATDSYYYRTAASGGNVTRINAGTWAVSSFPTTGGGSIPSRMNGCYNAFGYCPNLGGAYYVASYTGGVWFLRIH